MIVNARTNDAWLDIVDQLDVKLKWLPDAEHPESGAIVARLGNEIKIRVWSDGCNGNRKFYSEASWPRGGKTFASRNERTIGAAKMSATLAAKMLAAEILYDASAPTSPSD